MTTIEILNTRTALRLYRGNGDLVGVDLQVFSARAFARHIRELAQAVRQIARTIMSAPLAIA